MKDYADKRYLQYRPKPRRDVFACVMCFILGMAVVAVVMR
jgi:hypothetical protein